MVLFRLWIQDTGHSGRSSNTWSEITPLAVTQRPLWAASGRCPQCLMQGRPLLRKGKIAAGGSVGCTHVSGLLFSLLHSTAPSLAQQMRSHHRGRPPHQLSPPGQTLRQVPRRPRHSGASSASTRYERLRAFLSRLPCRRAISDNQSIIR